MHFQQVPRDQVRGYKIFTFGFSAALKVKGPQSLVNRWLKTFFTPKGSDPLDPAVGTILAGMIGGNISSDRSDVEDQVIMSINDANDQVRLQDMNGAYPVNECLNTVSLLRFEMPAADTIEFWVKLTNVAGERIVIHLTDLATR